MTNWKTQFKYDPLKSLLDCGNQAIIFFTKRDLLEVKVQSIEYIWNLPKAQKILKNQQSDGSWKPGGYKNKDSNTGVKYSLIETWRQFRYLIDQYEFNKNHTAIKKASEFLFSCQTKEGDIRGILANQYAPYYTGAIMYLLIKAGYGDDKRIEKGFKWLLKMRQNDGGWVIGSPGMVDIPNLTIKEACDLTSNKNRETMKAFNKSKPFSAAGTGMVIRAFAIHPDYRETEETFTAVKLLKSKFFKKDNYSSYEHPDNWIRFQYPFWWNNLVSALDSISLIGFSREDINISNALHWLMDHQEKNGLWKVSYSKIHKSTENAKTFEVQLWITLAICRIFKRFYKE
jgi:hypothetical protein